MSNSVKIAHVGCGYWGKNIARNLRDLGHLSLLVDAFPENAKALSEKIDQQTPTAGWEDMLADDSIDGVTLATPAPLHAEQAIAAMKAGKHVFVEKPMALNLDDCRAMAEVAQQTGKVLMVGHLLQYHSAFKMLRDQVAAGKIGAIHYINSNRLSLGKVRVQEDVLWSFAPHDVSMIYGLVQDLPQSVSAQQQAVITPGIADYVSAQMIFASGVQARINVSWMSPFKEQKLVVMGETGALVFEDSAPSPEEKLSYYPFNLDRAGREPVFAKQDRELLEYPKTQPLAQECQHFIDCIDQGVAPYTDAIEGQNVLDILLAIEKAMS